MKLPLPQKWHAKGGQGETGGSPRFSAQGHFPSWWWTWGRWLSYTWSNWTAVHADEIQTEFAVEDAPSSYNTASFLYVTAPCCPQARLCWPAHQKDKPSLALTCRHAPCSTPTARPCSYLCQPKLVDSMVPPGCDSCVPLLHPSGMLISPILASLGHWLPLTGLPKGSAAFSVITLCKVLWQEKH